MLLFSFPLARNNENGNIENRILIDCAPCTMIPIYIFCWLQGKDCCRRGHILKHYVRDELTTIKNSFVANIHSYPNLSYPICHY